VAGALAALLGLLAWMGWAVEWTQLKETLEGRLPAATRVALGLLEVLRWTGLPLALLLWAAARRLPARWVPGGAELSCAAGLRERSAQLRAGIALSPAQALMPTSSVLTRWERRYASALAERLGPTFAVDSVAQALEVGAERRRLLWWTLLPLGVLLLLVVFVLPLLLALYLPIFSIAGAIK